MSLPSVASPSTTNVSLGSITTVALLSQTPTTPYISVNLSKASLFPNGISYQVTLDPSGVASWSALASTTTSLSTIQNAFVAASWVGSSLTTPIDVSFNYKNQNKVLKFVPQIANMMIGTSGVGAHLLYMHANAYSLTPNISSNTLYGSNTSTISSAFQSSIASSLKSLLDSQAVQQQILATLVQTTGPILDLSTSGTKTYNLSAINPDMVLLLSLQGATLVYDINRMLVGPGIAPIHNTQLSIASIPFQVVLR